MHPKYPGLDSHSVLPITKPAAVLVHYRQAALTARCLDSLLTHCPSLKAIYIVDNSPGDGSLTELQEQFKDLRVRWLPQTGNLGFGAGCNAGIKAALAEQMDAVLLINNDAWVEQDIIRRFADASLEYAHQALLTGCIYEPDGQIWYAGGEFSLYTARAEHHHQMLSQSQSTDFASGCLMWLPLPLINVIQGFDPEYFLYIEDVDLNLRVSQAGFKIVCLADISIRHAASSSTGGRASETSVYYQNRNRWLLLRRHGKIRHWLVFVPFYLLGFAKRLLSGQARVSFAALWDGLLGRWGQRKV